MSDHADTNITTRGHADEGTDHLITTAAFREVGTDLSSILAEPARPAVIVNPTKLARRGQLSRFQVHVDQEFTSRGWRTPLWLPTAATLGRDEARAALTADVDVVLVAGGDGTIRAVAGELVGTRVPLGLLPLGTGNLLARNLGVPLDFAGAVRLVCEGADRSVSVGWLHVDRAGDGSELERHMFLVMAGAGFDAAMLAGASPALKRRLGHGAYLVAGARTVGRALTPVRVSVDGQPVLAGSAHGVVIGNCGTLTLGLALMPDAHIEDAVLDAVILLPHSLSGWARVAWTVASRPSRPQPLMPRLRGRSIDVRSAFPQRVQVDGDVVGEARHIQTEVQPAGLLVRWVPTRCPILPSKSGCGHPLTAPAPRTVRSGWTRL